MPPQVAYTVTATLPDEPTADEFIGWLRDGHVADVVRAGALSGHVVRIDDPPAPIRVEARYVFSDRDALDRYISDHAPRLRADGLARFPPERGITFERRVGRIITP